MEPSISDYGADMSGHFADTVAYPGFQAWRATQKHWHTDEFCALIDRHIQTAKPTIYDGYT